MFSKTSFSSELNNLTNISLSPRYAAICGYTDHDLDGICSGLEGLDRVKIRIWYNGYHWLGTEKLYNPHDILHLFYEREYTGYWFQSVWRAELSLSAIGAKQSQSYATGKTRSGCVFGFQV